MVGLVYGRTKGMKIIGLLLMFLIFPFSVGQVIGKRVNKIERECFSYIYILGLLTMLAVFHGLYLVAVFMGVPFHVLYVAYIIILCFVCVLYGVQVYQRDSVRLIGAYCLKKNILWYVCVAIIICQIVWQCYYTPFAYGDDFTYITMVNDIIQTDTIYGIDYHTGVPQAVGDILYKYLFTSYYPFLAVVQKISGIHALILCKTILPIILVPVSYMNVWLMGAYFFGKNINKRLLFLMFYWVINCFGCFSWYTISFRTLTWVWHSKAVLAIIILPFLFYQTNRMYDSEISKGDIIIQMIIITAACGTTMMGIGLAPMMLMMLAFVKSCQMRNVKLLGVGMICCSPAIISVIMFGIYKIVMR